jgi:hypothetical protein
VPVLFKFSRILADGVQHGSPVGVREFKWREEVDPPDSISHLGNARQTSDGRTYPARREAPADANGKPLPEGGPSEALLLAEFKRGREQAFAVSPTACIVAPASV